MSVVDKINSDLVKRVIHNLANEKNDSTYKFKSNALKTGMTPFVGPYVIS